MAGVCLWKEGYMEKQSVIKQLRRIEGQIRGVIGMIESDRGLVPTVQQFLAMQASLDSSMRNYISLFLEARDGDDIILTRDQMKYILSLISKK